jgi:hypothetical protein
MFLSVSSEYGWRQLKNSFSMQISASGTRRHVWAGQRVLALVSWRFEGQRDEKQWNLL